MSLMWKAVIVTAVLGLLLIFFEWNMKRKQKGGVSPSDWKSIRGLVLATIGACVLVAFAVANLF